MKGLKGQIRKGRRCNKLVSESNQRDASLDALRITATFCVVLLHVSAKVWVKEPIGSESWITATFFDSLVRWCAPAFVMISGSLLMGSDKPARVRERFLKIVLLYVVWSGFYSLIDWLETGDWGHALKHFVEGHYHLWYLYMIGGIFLILPLLKLLAKKKEYLQYYVVLAVLFNFLFPQVIQVVSLYSRSWYRILEFAFQEVGVNAVLGYSGYFVLGYLLYHYGVSKRGRLIMYLFGIAGVAVTFLGTKYYTETTLKLQEVFFSNFTINVLATSIAVFVLFKQWDVPQRWGKHLRTFSSYCLGIYLIHPIVLEALELYDPYLPEQIILRTLIAFVLSAIITRLLKMIPVIKKSVT